MPAPRIAPFFAAAFILYGLDQATKAWILSRYALGDIDPVVPGFFDLVHVANTGAAFGMFNQFPWFFLALKSVAFVVLLFLFFTRRLRTLHARAIGGLLLAGVAGNLTDRLLHGYVVDFLSFNLHVAFANPWPAFNVADACISAAAVLLVAHALVGRGEG